MGFNSGFKGLMYELTKIGKVFVSKFVGTGPSSYEKRIYPAMVSQILRNPDPYTVTNTRCRIGTIFSPDDGVTAPKHVGAILTL
jgi:hypothetical protein